ncbi:MAG TPA: hypothetical protein VKS79_06160 [Gemmataceae bacterium]|nr:hypothetical protein [Gemmataceae bacterium]
MKYWKLALAGMLAVLLPCPALPCSLCAGNPQTSQTLRHEADQVRLIVYGTLTNPRLNPDPLVGGGWTDLQIEQVLKNDPILAGRKTITIPKYLPVEPGKPVHFLLFCDVANDKLDILTGRPVSGAKMFEYVKAVLGLETKNRTKALQFYFQHLDSGVPEIAADAYLELAKANDQEIGQLAPTLEPSRLRKLLQDPNTPAERLGLFAYLLGGCGGKSDADLLLSLLKKDTDQTRSAYGGLLAGYIVLQPEAGWKLAAKALADPQRSFPERFAVLGTLRFFHGWKPRENHDPILAALKAAINESSLADMAIEDLRRWEWWDLTATILPNYGTKNYAAPLTRRAIVRYALSCPQPAAASFVAERKKAEPDFVADVAESLEIDKPATPRK